VSRLVDTASEAPAYAEGALAWASVGPRCLVPSRVGQDSTLLHPGKPGRSARRALCFRCTAFSNADDPSSLSPVQSVRGFQVLLKNSLSQGQCPTWRRWNPELVRVPAGARFPGFVAKWPFARTAPPLAALESRTCSGAPHSATRNRLNKLRNPYRLSFFKAFQPRLLTPYAGAKWVVAHLNKLRSPCRLSFPSLPTASTHPLRRGKVGRGHLNKLRSPCRLSFPSLPTASTHFLRRGKVGRGMGQGSLTCLQASSDGQATPAPVGQDTGTETGPMTLLFSLIS
jgi:hypothetical protein